MSFWLNIFWGLPIWAWTVIILGIFGAGIRIVRPVEKGLIERLGKYRKTGEQGFHWIIPIIDRMVKVNITENMVDVQPQRIITKDDLNATVDAVVYFRVLDSQKAIYSVDDYVTQITSLARTTLRDIIGKMSLSDANSKRDQLNSTLEKELDRQTSAWGIDVIRVELQRIEPPEDVQVAMNQVVKAEREKKAAIDFANATETEADGARRAEIKKAEGVKQGLILKAEGEAEAIKMVADARAQEIKLVNESITKYFKGDAQIYKKLETTADSLRSGSKFVIDSKSSIANVVTDVSGVPIIPLKQASKK